MPCYKPIVGKRGPKGQLVLTENNDFNEMEVPCGVCIGCKIDHSRSWAIRCVHEAQMHQENSYVTLTYADEHLPSNMSLDRGHYQNFMKELRREIYPKKIRFFACGEYSDPPALRPHFHACLFGIQFPDLKIIDYNHLQQPLYTSPLLEKVWRKGFSTIGEVTYESAAYVARYVMKKIRGDRAEEHYTRANRDTGELVQVEPEYNTSSRRPGLGRSWFEKFHKDVYPSDQVVIGSRIHKPPRYYDKLLEKTDPHLLEELKHQRLKFAALHHKDSTDERLEAREFCAAARINQLHRKL